jgi:hypothetical protein
MSLVPKAAGVKPSSSASRSDSLGRKSTSITLFHLFLITFNLVGSLAGQPGDEPGAKESDY